MKARNYMQVFYSNTRKRERTRIDDGNCPEWILSWATCLGVALMGVYVNASESGGELETSLIVDFQADSTPWRNVDDVVMGGVSSSRMRVESDYSVFEGVLSLENNGGFASVRSNLLEQDQDLAVYEGVRIRIRGDGNKYQLRIRTDPAFDGPSYRMRFETRKGIWSEVTLPFSEFVATYRGRPLPNHPPIDPEQIASLGFLIADEQEGEFRLDIDWVKAYRTKRITSSEE